MHIVKDPVTVEALLDELAQAGHLIREPPRGHGAAGRWTPAPGASGQGALHRDGNRYWATDLSGMLPLYRELYERVFARRLALWGAAEHDAVGLLSTGQLILFWGPAELMGELSPSARTLRSVAAADRPWVERLERRWRRAAAALEEEVERFWSGLCQGRATARGLDAVVDRKVTLTALGVDALMPPVQLTTEWLAAWVPAPLLPDVVEGCYLPASGYVAYDLLEAECWELAASFQAAGDLTVQARRRFLQQGLFFLYDALNTDRKRYYFERYPTEIARIYGRAASGPDAIGARIQEVRRRDWKRRFHHQWARERIGDCVADTGARRRLFVLHRLLGTARDFDEEKRRLNRDVWRSLFALADGVGISLTNPDAGLSCLRDAITDRGGRVVIDPMLTT
jgi:hypothetical protein